MDKRIEMRNLIEEMKRESKAYYQDSNPLVPDHIYDQQYDRLVELEKELGIIYADSPTQIVSGGVSGKLQKVTHTQPMLSCDKLQDKVALAKKFGSHPVVMSYKMDGLTLVVRYKDHRLQQIITRGDGLVGEDVTHNAPALGVPAWIPYEEELELRGEGVISMEDFNAFNVDDTYSHPRNLASGTMRLQDPREAIDRHVTLFAFDLIVPFLPTKSQQYDFLSNLGFRVVEHQFVQGEEQIIQMMDYFKEDYEYPVDGIIIEHEDVVYGKSLGATGHHENCRMAFKWEDPKFKTKFRRLVVATTRTGRISLKAEFDPVVIEGSTVSRATLHNLDFFSKLHLGEGDVIEVFKAHKIIPAVYRNLTNSETCQLPTACPCCGSALIESDGQLYCTNDQCSAKKLRQFEHFVSKGSMNIDGIGSSSLSTLLSEGYVHSYADLFRLEQHRSSLEKLPGWGQSSVSSMLASIEAARKTSLMLLIPAFGIPMVGKSAGKQIHKHFHGDVAAFTAAACGDYDFTQLQDFGQIMNKNLHDFFADPENFYWWNDLLTEVSWSVDEELVQPTGTLPLSGMTVVATGKMPLSRDQINALIESLGGKAGGSVSKKTSLVVVGSDAGSKKEKAESLGVPIMSIEEFLKKYN